MTDARDALVHGLRKEVSRVQAENEKLDADLVKMRIQVRHSEELARMYSKSDKAVWLVGHERADGFDIVAAFGNATGARRFVEEFPNLTQMKIWLGRKNAKTNKARNVFIDLVKSTDRKIFARLERELDDLAHG